MNQQVVYMFIHFSTITSQCLSSSANMIHTYKIFTYHLSEILFLKNHSFISSNLFICTVFVCLFVFLQLFLFLNSFSVYLAKDGKDVIVSILARVSHNIDTIDTTELHCLGHVASIWSHSANIYKYKIILHT